MVAEHHVSDQLPAYALGALGQVEALQVEQHLKSCQVCADEFATYLPVINSIPLAIVEKTPDPRVKARLFERLREAKPAPVLPGQPGTWLERLAAAWRQRPGMGLALSLAVIFLLLVSNLGLWVRLQRLEDTREFRTSQLTGTDNAPGASGMLVISKNGSLGTLVVDNLPALDNGMQYQVWLIKDGMRTSGGVFSTDGSGYGALAIASPEPLNSYQAVGITIEPAGGSAGPTGKKVMGGDLER